MAERLISIREEDVPLLRRVIQEVLRDQRPKGGRTEAPEDTRYAPECYVALTPAGGIPALSQSSTTGTGSDDPLDDVPGHADCLIYRINPYTTPAGIQRIPGLSKRVYNLSTTAVPQAELVPVVRDKFGSWLAVPLQQAGSGGAGSLTVEDAIDGNPSHAARTKVRFPQDWFRISDEGAGSEQIRLATSEINLGNLAANTTALDLTVKAGSYAITPTGSSARYIAGIVPQYGDGEFIIIRNGSTSLPLHLSLEDTGATAANRIYQGWRQFLSLAGTSKFVLSINPRDAVTLMYSGALARWLVVSQTYPSPVDCLSNLTPGDTSTLLGLSVGTTHNINVDTTTRVGNANIDALAYGGKHFFGNGGFTLVGLQSGGPSRSFFLGLTAGGGNIVIAHESALATAAADRILCPGAANLTVRAPGGVVLLYLTSSSRWIVLQP